MDLSCLIGSILSLTCVLEKEQRFEGQPGALDINIFFFPFRLMYAFWCLFYCVESQSLFFVLSTAPAPSALPTLFPRIKRQKRRRGKKGERKKKRQSFDCSLARGRRRTDEKGGDHLLLQRRRRREEGSLGNTGGKEKGR